MTSLAVEMSASRLLDPFFGNSQIVWAAIIGLILLYLTVGYFIGGRWADRDPRSSTLFQIIAWGAFLVGLVPFIAAPVLRWSVQGLAQFNAGILAGSLVGVLVLFSVPITLLGDRLPVCHSPGVAGCAARRTHRRFHLRPQYAGQPVRDIFAGTRSHPRHRHPLDLFRLLTSVAGRQPGWIIDNSSPARFGLRRHAGGAGRPESAVAGRSHQIHPRPGLRNRIELQLHLRHRIQG